VPVLPLAFHPGSVVVQPGLYPLPHLLLHDRLMAPVEHHSLIGNQSDIGRVAEHVVEGALRYRVAPLRSEPPLVHLVRKRTNRPLTRGELSERLSDERGLKFIGDNDRFTPALTRLRLEPNVLVSDGSKVGIPTRLDLLLDVGSNGLPVLLRAVLVHRCHHTLE